MLLGGALPLADLPNHLARAYILEHLGQSADLQKYYGVEWRLLSFQSTDFILPPLATLFGLMAAAKIYAAATFLALLGGTAALHRSLFGRVGLWPAASALFLFNFAFAWGFLAYLMAAGLVLLLLAGWISSEASRGWLRAALFAAAAVLLLLCHFFAFAVYAVIVTVYELDRAWRGRGMPHRLHALVEAAGTLLPATVLVLVSIDPGVPTIFQAAGFADIARGMVSPTIMYMDWADLAVTYAVPIAFWLLFRRKALRFDRRFLLPIIVLFLLAVAMPASVSSVWGANLRIPCLLAFLLVAVSEVSLSRRGEWVLCTLLILLVFMRVIALTLTWRDYDHEIAAFRAAAAKIEPGARVLATAFPEDYQQRRNPAIFPLVHVAAYAVIDRDVFLPSLFTFATPLRFTTPPRTLEDNARLAAHWRDWLPSAAFTGTDAATRQAVSAFGQRNFLYDSYLTTIDWSRWPEDYDYLVDYRFEPAGNPVPALLTEVARGDWFTIYRIHPPHGQAPQ
jgi:hypothetical protein